MNMVLRIRLWGEKMAELKPCPKCGAKAVLLNCEIDDLFYMGYSVGCPRYFVGDGIHGVDSFDVDESKHYRLFGFATKGKAIEAWNRRATE